MDTWVREKLTEWGLKRYPGVFEAFEEQGVDHMAFSCLTENAIKEIIPKLGPQCVFLKFWDAEFGKSGFDNSEKTCPIKNKSNMALRLDKHDILIHELTKGLRTPNKNQHPVPTGIFVSTLQVPDDSGPSDYDKNKFWLIDSADIKLKPCNPITNLIETLRESGEGIAVLKYYKQHRDLTDEHRKFLVDIIISTELSSTPRLAVKPERLEELAGLISETFPTEVKATYYVPYHYDLVNKRRICPGGKLVNRHGQRRSYLLACGATERRKKTNRKSQDKPAPFHLALRKDFKSDSN